MWPLSLPQDTITETELVVGLAVGLTEDLIEDPTEVETEVETEETTHPRHISRSTISHSANSTTTLDRGSEEAANQAAILWEATAATPMAMATPTATVVVVGGREGGIEILKWGVFDVCSGMS